MTNLFENLTEDVVSEISSSVGKQLKIKVDYAVATKLAALFHDTSNEIDTKRLPDDIRKDPDLGRWCMLVKEEMRKLIHEEFFDNYIRGLIRASIRKRIDQAVDEAVGDEIEMTVEKAAAELPASTYSSIHQSITPP